MKKKMKISFDKFFIKKRKMCLIYYYNSKNLQHGPMCVHKVEFVTLDYAIL